MRLEFQVATYGVKESIEKGGSSRPADGFDQLRGLAAGGIVFGLFLVYGMERLFGLSLGIAKTPVNVIRIAAAFFFWFVLVVGVIPLLQGGRWGRG